MFDDDVPEPPYSGPIVVIEPEGRHYRVETRPVMPTGEGSPRLYGSKTEAFSAAQALWTPNRLPVLDLTDGHVAGHRKE